jgi:hypothetical protein
MSKYSVGQTVKMLLETPKYGAWATGYVESHSCGVYGIRVWGHDLYHVQENKLELLEEDALP